MIATYKTAVVCALLVLASADCMLHGSLMGTRNRNAEKSENAQDTRCFNSQTNNESGRGVALEEATLYYGAILSVEWTSQHACLSGWSQCEWVLQWLCQSEAPPAARVGDVGGFRDNGETQRDEAVNRAHTDVNDPGLVDNCNQDQENTGTEDDDQNNPSPGISNCLTCRYESGAYWAEASKRSRNINLFTGVVEVNGGAQNTRQSNAGAEYGTEVAEERDYYPWFHPDPFRDIVIFTENLTLCSWYEENSMNVKNRGRCVGGPETANNAADCAGGNWVEEGSHEIDPPECLLAPHSRTNHNGNGGGGDDVNTFISYNFTIKDMPTPNRCQIRLRYNISSSDISWFADYRDDETTVVDENNPNYPVAPDINLQLQVNPAQFSRTFEDRSSIYKIVDMTDAMKDGCKKVWMVGFKGRRGDIVQTYPATEYDFHPQRLHINPGDCVYYWFSGTDGYDGGENLAGGGQTDRDAWNLIGMNDVCENYPLAIENQIFPPAVLGGGDLETWRRTAAMGCTDVAVHAEETDLDDSPYLCEMEPVVFDKLAVYHYMSTRTNQWSNRSCKGTTHVVNAFSSLTLATLMVGLVLFMAGAVALMSAYYAKNHPNSTVARIFQNGGSRGSGILSSRGGSSYGSRSRGGSSGPSRGSRGSRGSRSRSHGSRKR